MRERRDLMTPVPDSMEIVKPIEPKGMPPYHGPYRMDGGNEDKIHLLDYWRSIRKRLWLVIGVTVLLTSLVAIYQSRKPDIYEAKSQVQVDNERINPALGSKENAVVLQNSGNDPAYFNTQLQILTSDGLLRQVVKNLDFENNKDFLTPKSVKNQSLWQSFLRTIGLGEKEKQKASEELAVAPSSASASTSESLAEAQRLSPYVTVLRKNLIVDPVRESRLPSKETRLIDISFRHTDPTVAAKVVNMLADTFAEQNRVRREESTIETSSYLKKRLAEITTEIRKDQENLAKYGKDKNIINLSGDDNIVIQKLAGLNIELLKAENARKDAESKYNAVVRTQGAGKAKIIDENLRRYLEEIDSKITALRAKRGELLIENTEEWPPVKELTQAIEVLENEKNKAIDQADDIYTKNLATDLRRARDYEEKLRSDFNKQRNLATNQNEAAINYNIIKQRFETNQNLLKDLQRQEKDNDIAQAGTPNNIHVVDHSIVPDEPIGPRRLMSVMMAFMLALAFGCGLALFLEYLDDTVRSTEDVENLLRLPALAVIPSIDSGQRRRLLLASGSQTENGDTSQTSELLIRSDSRSSLAEAYRQLRTSVLLSTAGHAPKTLLVTSSVPSEGKTTTAVNTAISLSQTGAKVLVIDADMRRPRLHNIFHIENYAGLSTVLSSEMTEREVLSVVTRHENTSLHLMTSGPVPPNPAELIGSEQMRRLLRTLERNFTHIVIDSPPIASFTDGVLVSTMVDGVLLVVHAGKSSRGIVRRSRQLLQDVGAKIFGVVLNNVNIKSQDGYYFYQSYYQQSYYNRAEEENDSTNT